MNSGEHHDQGRGPTPVNRFGQPIGRSLPDWTPPPRPDGAVLQGSSCRVEPLDPVRHAAGLYAANKAGADDSAWTYLSIGPFEDEASYRAWLASVAHLPDPFFYTIMVDEEPLGVASFMRIDPPNGVIEIGHINLSPALQRTRMATEALTLLIGYGFALGYRRFEWKCDSLNAPSRAAALRLGFRFEGIFRQAVVTRCRNRDTAWFSIIDSEWPAVARAHAQWLAPANFDGEGRQRQSLRALTATTASKG